MTKKEETIYSTGIQFAPFCFFVASLISYMENLKVSDILFHFL